MSHLPFDVVGYFSLSYLHLFLLFRAALPYLLLSVDRIYQVQCFSVIKRDKCAFRCRKLPL